VAAIASAISASTVGAAPCDTGRQADLSLSQSAAPGPGGTTVFTLVAMNNGPACAPGATIVVELSGSYVSYSSVDPGSWTCTTPPLSAPATVTCTLAATLGVGSPGSTGTVQVTASGGSTDHAVLSSDAIDNEDPLNNEVWGTYGKTVNTGTPILDFDATQATVPANAGIAIQQVNENSALSPQGPAPCEATSDGCLGSQEILIETADTNPALFPKVHLTFTFTIYAPGTDLKTITVYRYVDSEFPPPNNTPGWVALPSSCNNFSGDPNVGCVKSTSIDKKTGIVTVIVWAAHNGHSRVG
jgi:hypothetical protein